MSKKEPKKELKAELVKISFCPKKLDCADSDTIIYGIAVKKEGKKLVGKVGKAIKDALLSAGKCEK